MSWRVKCIMNNLCVPKKAAKELAKAADDYWYEPSEAVVKDENGESILGLNYDAMEWIDVIANHDEVVEVLKKHKADGCIMFGQVEGDGGPMFWGYKFTSGKMEELEGKLIWETKKKKT